LQRTVWFLGRAAKICSITFLTNFYTAFCTHKFNITIYLVLQIAVSFIQKAAKIGSELMLPNLFEAIRLLESIERFTGKAFSDLIYLFDIK
jgi:hypothetical protein